MPDSIQRLDAQILKKKPGLQRRAHQPFPPQPGVSGCLRRAGPAGVHRNARLAAHRRRSLEGAGSCRTAARWSASAAATPASFVGAGISGSADDEAFISAPTKPSTGWTPPAPRQARGTTRKSQLLEDVYAYNDYSYAGRGAGCENRAAVTPDPVRATSSARSADRTSPPSPFDDEPHRLVQALRYAAGINDAIAQQGVAGALGWCMADYNTHREFGSGDRICYHGVMDMFRNPKLSAAVYASQKTPRPLGHRAGSLSPAWHWATCPAAFPAACWVFTNAESVRLYRGNDFVAEFAPDRRGRFAALPHPPIEINDFVGSLLEKYEGMDHATGATGRRYPERDAARCHGAFRRCPGHGCFRCGWAGTRCPHVLQIHRRAGHIRAAAYRFEAVWHGRAVRTVVREPVQSVRLECTVHNPL